MLSLLYNAELRPVRLPYGDAGEMLPYRRVSFGADTLELGPAADLPRGLAALVSAKDYPGQTMPGMLDELLRIPAEMVVTQSFAFVDRQASLGRMNLALRRMRASDDEALSLRGELAQAKDEVAAGRAAFGEHHLTVMVRGPGQGEVDAGVAEVLSALTDLGMIAVREDLGLEAAFWAQFPGNFAYIARRALIGSANFASLASGHNFPLGSPTGNHWGAAVATFETTAAGPYHFNFHAKGGAGGDLGNFTVIGPSGSGKTVIVNFLLAQARRFAPRIVFFDKDRGAELFIRAIGGVYDVLRPGVPSRMNPLLLADTPENRRFLMEWVVRLAGSDGEPVTPDEAAQIKEAVDASMAAPPAYRRLRSFVELLRGGSPPACRRPPRTHAGVVGRGRACLAVRQCHGRNRPRPRSDRLRHDPAARRPGAAHPGDDVHVPPRRRTARWQPRDHRRRRGLEGARRRSVCRSASATGKRPSASATASSASSPRTPRTRCPAASPRRSSNRPQRRSSLPTPRRRAATMSPASG